ncbi:fatty acyl-AMP ligase [Candidatus Protofrankia datiscae]|uniref:Long-chain-fatty-acid--(Acyl-carrier-protein) ligase n=1 Tax=Candidatus Protofrankia datiscae TaxID=2716812 RepID=F8AWV9_9ACTN|nr:fatty acyl-AMP ligase [Candidatus Protofrankia datiscae]AEH10339.1 Long-chain-fatty-acid--(acyl-carrier-protein) ligase [Candidatus Protofrankia datiscae]
MTRQKMLLPDVLRGRAALEPTGRAYVFLDEYEKEKEVLTYGELHARALAVAGWLSRRCGAGDRALLVFPPGLDFIVAYFGCLYAQVVAVPVNPPRKQQVQDTTLRIVRDCEPSAVLTANAMIESTRSALEPVHTVPHWLPVDRITDMAETGFDPSPCSADSIAFLQYTSGSTSDPKGVVVSHGNLAANQEMIRQAFGHDRNSTFVGWAPLFHDQGLIGNVLQPLWIGATSILMSPMAFIRWPLLWLSAISRYRAHTSGGPNFAFDACVTRAARGDIPELDLSCWKVAFNGAEPIRPETLRRFAETFASYGFSEKTLYPCYGLAEATLLVTGSQKGRGPRTIEADADALGDRRYAEASNGHARTLAGSGLILPEETLRIVDPETKRPCPADRVGEIWVAGEHVAQGYWRCPQATTDTFRATCDGEPGRTYLRTGDLGLVVDGELYVVGRLKDLVIIRGRNYCPQDIEHTVQSSHDALRSGGCAAFSVLGPDGEKLVVVQEIRGDQRRKADVRDVTASIRAAVVREHDLSLGDLVLTLPGRLQKTSSGKIMRAAARKRYLEAGFDTWTPAAPSAA